MMTHFIVPSLIFYALTLATDAHPDRVTSLPSAPVEPIFPLYSGFLHAQDQNIDYKLFYVLCEAIHTDPSEAPLLIWLNGGPGSSSLFAFLLSHGPYRLNAETLQLTYNDFSWNQYANVLYVESPSGVGFSHSNDTNNHSYDDVTTARINRKVLQNFMNRVHPRYAFRDFYITGESYAGVYIPYLTREILNHTKSGEFTNTNFRGIAMGNAHVDHFSEDVASALQLYSLGMIPEKYGKELFAVWGQLTGGKYDSITLSPDLDILLLDLKYNHFGNKAVYNMPLQCNEKNNPEVWHIAKPSRNVECIPEGLTGYYLNREDVQVRMNVRTKDQPAVLWRMHNDKIFMAYETETDTIPIYRDIFESIQGEFRILFYTGDLDLICPPLQVAFGARRIAEENGMSAIDTPNWFYLNDYGGSRTSYVTNDRRIIMDVLTVRGSSHSVPITTPDRAFQLINNFISSGIEINYSKTIPRK